MADDPLEFIGRGVITPFRRDRKLDLANGSGLDVIRSNIQTILHTTCASRQTQGEIPFNQRLGSLVQRLRHQNMDTETFREIALYYVIDSLRINEPRVLVRDVIIIKNPPEYKVTIKVIYDVVDVGTPGDTVLAPGQTVEVTL